MLLSERSRSRRVELPCRAAASRAIPKSPISFLPRESWVMAQLAVRSISRQGQPKSPSRAAFQSSTRKLETLIRSRTNWRRWAGSMGLPLMSRAWREGEVTAEREAERKARAGVERWEKERSRRWKERRRGRRERREGRAGGRRERRRGRGE